MELAVTIESSCGGKEEEGLRIHSGAIGWFQ